VSSLLTVWHDLVELVGLNKSLDDFVWCSSLLEDSQGKLWVVLSNEVSELVRHGKLILFDPVFDQTDFSLLKDWTGNFHGLNIIELSGFKEGGVVDHDWLMASSGWNLLELVDSILVSN
jgi:hypothetical protein